MILSTAFCLEGCKSREQRLSEETVYEDAQMNAMNKKVVKCINEQDKEGLKKLFSKDVQNHIEDLDGKIDEMLEAFKGESIVSVKSEPVDSSRTNDYGKESISIYGEPPSGKTIPANGICLCRYEDVSRGSLQAPDIPIIER